MAIRKLTCPGCGAHVDIPADLDHAHCIYCGSKLVFNRVHEAECEAIKTHLKLGHTALEANNCKEALEHFNKALEADPKNEEACFGKACAYHGLSTATHDRLDEALHYIEKALELDSGSIVPPPRPSAEKGLRNLQVVPSPLAATAFKD